MFVYLFLQFCLLCLRSKPSGKLLLFGKFPFLNRCFPFILMTCDDNVILIFIAFQLYFGNHKQFKVTVFEASVQRFSSRAALVVRLNNIVL